jgi:hypothetical protein
MFSTQAKIISPAGIPVFPSFTNFSKLGMTLVSAVTGEIKNCSVKIVNNMINILFIIILTYKKRSKIDLLEVSFKIVQNRVRSK